MDVATRVLGLHLHVLRAQYWVADDIGEHLQSSGWYVDGVER
ncbi:hypothetical protein AB5I41_07685 [Sphingomonas sp. MMS24-JH45]